MYAYVHEYIIINKLLFVCKYVCRYVWRAHLDKELLGERCIYIY